MSKYLCKYYRISLEDENEIESNSITNQRQIVESHISTIPELANMRSIEIIDDGHTGTNFSRPGMIQLLDAARKGEISCIVVKDLSRFGRKFLEASKYIEQLFPYLGIRFIAVGDNYDSNTHEGTTANLDIPVKNMLNAFYSKDISKKVKSAKRTQAQQGKCINAFAFFGYKKDSKDRHKLVIDEPAAEIVKRIFELSCIGILPKQIADIFNDEGVLTPYMYKKKNGSNYENHNITAALWSSSCVRTLLRDERYTGIFIGGKVEIREVGSAKCFRKPKDDWIRVPNAIPAIITKELWNRIEANRLRKGGNQTNEPNKNRILYRRVRCGYCGRVMRYRAESKRRYYSCLTAKYTNKYGCRSTQYNEEIIVNTVKTVVQSQITVMLDLKQLSITLKNSSKKSSLSAKVAINGLSSEIEQLKSAKRKLYESYKTGSLDKETYFTEREIVENKISEKALFRETIASQNIGQEETLNSAHHFFDFFTKLCDSDEQTAEVVNALVVAVHVFIKDRIEIKFEFADKLKEALQALNQSLQKNIQYSNFTFGSRCLC